ncbi:Gfo/Idh/MocA family oxidoreductase [Fodinicola feengrottensis]|uniref:Gfo/Idh/MocA family oxidoreductase n=1 Tax=Fodinicola feengrottensis TaxID=435914 RepID=A0ABP4S1E8_9ACTN
MPLSIGLIGSGFIARSHAAAWQQLGTTLFLYSNDPPAATALAGQYGGTVVDELDMLLGQVDAVDICTPTDTHADIAVRAAAAGRHVICEKPLERTHAQGQRIIDACAEAGVHLFVAHVVRYFGEYATAQAAVAGGEIGSPAVLRLTRSGARPEWATWLHNEQRAGGILLDFMIHDYDFARWIGGEVTSVYATVTGSDGPVSGTVVLRHENGTISHIQGTWSRPGEPFRTTFDLAGSGGVLTGDSLRRPPVTISVPEPAAIGHALADDPYTAELAEFAAAIAGGPPPRVNAADGLAALDIALAALESARSGRAVSPTQVA